MYSTSRLFARLVALALLLALSPLARANSIVVGNHNLLPNTPGQVVNLMVTGTDQYNSFDLKSFINGGLAGGPAISHVFGDPAAAIPATNLVGSVWEGGNGGIGVNYPEGTTTVGSGYQTFATFTTLMGELTTANGIVVSLTFDTTGVAPGVYSFSLTDGPMGPTAMFAGYDLETWEPIVTPLTIVNGTLTVVPEPASLVTAALAIAGLLAVAIRRRLLG